MSRELDRLLAERREARRGADDARRALKDAAAAEQRRLLDEGPARRAAWEKAVDDRLAQQGVVVSDRGVVAEVHERGVLKHRAWTRDAAWHFARTTWAADVPL